MTEKRFKDIGCHIKNMGYDKNVKFGNYTTIFTTEYGDVLITDYDIKFPNNPNCYYANKKKYRRCSLFRSSTLCPTIMAFHYPPST